MNRVVKRRQDNLVELITRPSIKSGLGTKDGPFKFGAIDTIDKAYLLGYLIACGSVSANAYVKFPLDVKNYELARQIYQAFNFDMYGQTVKYAGSDHSTLIICKRITDVNKHINSLTIENRNVPMISRELEVYMLRGIYDFCGTLMWGFRKDRKTVWHKIVLQSSYSILQSVQLTLCKKAKIASTLALDSKSKKAYNLTIQLESEIGKFYKYIYADKKFMPCRNEFCKYEALRHELGGFSEKLRQNKTQKILSGATDRSVERAETTGGKNGALNNQISTQGSKKKRSKI